MKNVICNCCNNETKPFIMEKGVNFCFACIEYIVKLSKTNDVEPYIELTKQAEYIKNSNQAN